MRARLLAALLPAAMLSLPACGGSDDSSSPSAESSASTLTGSPIIIGMTSQDSGDRSNPAFADGLEAWVDRANSTTGIDGHPVELVRCDSKSLSDGEQQCSQQLAADESVLAVSGMGGFVGTVSVPTYEQQQVGLVSISMFVPQEYQSPIGIALNGGLISTNSVLMEHFKSEGAKSVSMVRVDVASAAAVAAQYEAVAGELGLTWEGTTAIAPTATDILPSVTQALSEEPDILLTQLHPALLKGVLQAMETLGSDVPVLSPGGSITADILEMPEARDRLYFTSDFSDPRKDDAHAEDYEYLQSRFGSEMTDPNVLGYILGEAFKTAIEGAGGAEATRASVLEFIQTGTFEDLPWMPSEISRSDAPTEYPAVANLGAYVVRIDSEGNKSYESDLITPTAF